MSVLSSSQISSFWNDLPFDTNSREDMRIAYLEKRMLEAIREASKQNMSLRCQANDHGCQNDGSSCLCRCHDKIKR
jgi:hypothetical protein